ncbi:ABC transporter transmembrane region 2-domain-containing protein [Catenaria anguillulae PL171]|uniref:ABC transporter transmembrane region 2-domain-containing protein n=1 Tax=Catenaria anguillulae PL171 TaxID=765915 RepID=A0A1Y2I073_9FUNG|nr:ABC transporter transmembrane region 2-domain-containing protein [Catenaria anguillulae PL171]
MAHRRRQRRAAKAPEDEALAVADLPDADAQFEIRQLFAQLPPTNQRVGVNKEFFRQLKAILRICIPGIKSKEILILALHTLFLLLRTYLSVVVARIDGRIVRDLVAANGKEFLRGLGYWFAIALPATYTNSMIRYLQSKLAIAFRTRMMHYVNSLYLDKEQGFYRLLTLDNRIESPDQYIVTDIARFCDAVASLYSNVGKPVIDIVIFNIQLARYIGWTGMGGLFLNYMVTARLLRAATPAFGKLAAQEAKLEGNFRTAHTRLTMNGEEVCFYNGESREKGILEESYKRLVKHINSIYKTRIGYNMFEDFLIKYVWSAVGLGVCAVPVFLPQYSGSKARAQEAAAAATSTSTSGASSSDATLMQGSSNMPDPTPVDPTPKAAKNHTQAFITNKRLLLSLADAGGRIMQSYKEMAELAGFTSRVYSLLNTLHAVHDGQFLGDVAAKHSLGNIRGQITEISDASQLILEGVDVVVPNANGGSGQVLVSNLNLKLREGDHLMIQGGNGQGKTSIARIMRGLWPLFEGHVHRPSLENMFFVPQRPYLVLGSLRDQVIYPHSVAQMRAAGKTDEDLMHVLEMVHLAYLPSREGGWDTVKEWKDVCSGGEKQRLNFARVLYHAPRWAVLDECVSAVSADVSGLMYSRAKDMGITIITISHSPALAKYHNLILKIHDDGEYEVTQIGTVEEEMSLEKEIHAIEERIRDLPKHKRRLEEVNIELGLAQK